MIELGFELTIYFKDNLNMVEFDNIVDDFFRDAIEKNGLLFGGGGYLDSYNGFITRADTTIQLSDIEVENVKRWIESRRDMIKHYEIGELQDANK